MDLAKLGLKPFKKVENNESVQSAGTSPAGGGNVGGDDSVVRDPGPVPTGGIPGTPDDASRSVKTNPLAALMAKQRTSQVVESPAPETAKPAGNPLQALMAKQPKAPEPKAGGANLPSVLDVGLVETIPVGPEGFQWHLDRLDALVQRDGGISALTQDSIKSRIKDLFTELNEHPEYDGLIIDRDVHNIMKFMQHSLSATKLVVEKKTATRTAKKAAADSKPKITFDLSGMDDMLLAGHAAPKSIADLGTLDVDAVATKFHRGGKS